jgi:predicted ArsR family transcriptional regulator
MVSLYSKNVLFLIMKQQRGNEIDEEILKHMESLEWPSTTEDIADTIKISWQTAQIHLFKLQSERKIKYRKVGRQNQWWFNKNYKNEFG